jgi:hypothetical protein
VKKTIGTFIVLLVVLLIAISQQIGTPLTEREAMQSALTARLARSGSMTRELTTSPSPGGITALVDGRGGSGGSSEGDPIGAENDQVPPDGYSETINVTAHGDVFDSTAWTFFLLGGTPPNPVSQGPPTGPPDEYDNPFGPCGAFTVEAYECRSIDPNSRIGRLSGWGKSIASQAMINDKKCNDFMHDPSGALRAAGYAGNPSLDPSRVAKFNELWNHGKPYMTGYPPYCNDPHLPKDAYTIYGAETTWLCEDHFYYLHVDQLPTVLMHEFLHILGLSDGQGQASEGGAGVVNGAIGIACGQAIANAEENSQMPQ